MMSNECTCTFRNDGRYGPLCPSCTVWEALEAAHDYFDQRADADGDSTGYTGNEEMRLLVQIKSALRFIAGAGRFVIANHTGDSQTALSAKCIQICDTPNIAAPSNSGDVKVRNAQQSSDTFEFCPHQRLTRTTDAGRSQASAAVVDWIIEIAAALESRWDSRGEDVMPRGMWLDLAEAVAERVGPRYAERGAALIRQMDANEELADEIARLRSERVEFAAVLDEARECLVRHDVAEKWPYEQVVIDRADALLAKIGGGQ